MRAFNNLTNDFQRLVAGRSIARDLDAVGINFYPAERAFQVKIYEPPRENTPVRETDAPLLRWLAARDMIRCRTHGASTSDSRDYIALKNRSDENMTALFRTLEAWYPGVSAIRDSLCTLSALPVTDAPDQRFAALSTIALKQKPGQMPTLNLEWLLRRLPDPDQPGQDFRYDDATYLSALATARSTPLVSLADALQRHWFAYEKSCALHLWLAAVDLAPDGYQRWKIYLRGDGRSLSLAHLAPFAHLHANAASGLRQLSEFARTQPTLQLYGFAISLDSHDHAALNTYFIEE